MNQAIHQAWTQLTPLEHLLVGVAIVLFVLGVSFIAFIFLSRVIKSRQEVRAEKARNETRAILNTLIVNESHRQDQNRAAAYETSISTLATAVASSEFKKQILIDQLIELKKNLTGSSVSLLVMLYTSIELYKLSLRKLTRSFWYDKAKGIRELAEMQYHPAVPVIAPFANDSNRILRDEAILALLNLSSNNPLSFLDRFEGEVSLWMRLNLHRNLQKLDVRKLPEFSQWFGHRNESVVLFSVSMARAFRQLSAVPMLIHLFSHKSKRVIGLAIETLGSLEASESADAIAGLLAVHSNDEKITSRAVRTLGNIGSEKHINQVLTVLNHQSYKVRFEAVRTLNKLGVTFNEIISKSPHNDIERITLHLSDPLLA